MHKHRTLIEAAQCAMPHACGWYVFAVENDEGRQLSEEEDERQPCADIHDISCEAATLR
jgi:hypothetical protein